MTERSTPAPTTPPSVDPTPDVEALEDRLALDGRSLRRHTAQGVLINSAFNIGLTGLGLVQRVTVAALLTTSEFGLWGLLVATMLTLTLLKQVGIAEKYVQQSERNQELAFQKAFTIELGYSMLYWLVVVALLPVYALIYGTPEIMFPGLVLSLALIVSALHTPIWISFRQMRFVRQRTLEALNPVVTTLVTIGLAVGGAGYWSLVIGNLAGCVAAAVGALATCPYRLAIRFDRGALRDYFSFSWPLLAARGSQLVVVQGTMVVGSWTVGLAGLGALALASTFSAYVDRVDDIIRRTMYPAVCAVRDRTELLFEAFTKSNRLALMWGVPFGIGLTLFAPDLVTFLLGEKWRPAEGLLQAFGAILALRQVAFNWTLFMSATGYTRPMAVNGALTVAAFLVAVVPLMIWLGLTGYAIGMVVVVVVQLVVRTYYLSKLFAGFRLLRHLGRAISPSVPAVAAVLAARAVPGVERSPEVAIAELLLYLAVTAAATFVFERRLLSEVLGYVRGAPRPVPAE